VSFPPGVESGASRLRSLVSRHHYLSVFVFILLTKAFFWTWSLAVAHRFPVPPETYFRGGHHYGIDPRIAEHRVDFLSLWIYADAEWYLSIAEHGYPNAAEMKQATAALGHCAPVRRSMTKKRSAALTA